MARSGRRSALTRAAAAAAGLYLAARAGSAFVIGGASAPAARALRGVALQAEAEKAPESVALVKMTDENKVTTASILGGLAGLLVGGVWVGAGLFTAGAFLSRKDDDVSKALKGVAAGGMEALNFASYLNDKYTVTSGLGSAIENALESGKSGSSGEAATSVSNFLSGAVDAVKAADADIDFKGTFGTLANSASDLASQAVDKAVEVNDKYKLTDQIKEKIDEAASGVSSAASSASKTS